MFDGDVAGSKNHRLDCSQANKQTKGAVSGGHSGIAGLSDACANVVGVLDFGGGGPEVDGLGPVHDGHKRDFRAGQCVGVFHFRGRIKNRCR